MPRLNVVEPSEAQGKTKEIFADLEKSKGKVFNIFKGMGNSPAALKAYLAMAGALGEGELAPEDREAVYLGVSQSNGCNYCVAAHTVIAKKAGMTDDQIKAIRKLDPLSEKHQALLNFVKRVMETKGFVNDADVAAVRSAGYTDGQIAESIAFIALATYSNYFNHVFDTPLDFPQAPEL
ncbi:MAG: carboxymuconolactone decarboxylase family protein [Planctomycetes bacterium]|nr:carboxymuconolactone decarboxylase family protein [Planctomycetota bacterium]